jgi:hypothetical protein
MEEFEELNEEQKDPRFEPQPGAFTIKLFTAMIYRFS